MSQKVYWEVTKHRSVTANNEQANDNKLNMQAPDIGKYISNVITKSSASNILDRGRKRASRIYKILHLRSDREYSNAY